MSIDDFARPYLLGGLALLVPVLVGYVLAQRRTRRDTLRFANLDLLDRVAPRRPGVARHLGIGLLSASLALLLVAAAGPTAPQQVPRNRATVMLAIDVSLSMMATDVEPDRLTAAQEAAVSFVDDLTPGVNLGLISFAGIASVLVSPTTDREPIRQAIGGLRLDERTATGEAIIAALAAIEAFGAMIPGADGPAPARIVVMTDGKRTVGRTEVDAAERARAAGVPVSMIAFGTERGWVEIDGTRIDVALDTAAMRQIAEISGGDFHTAHTAEELAGIYEQLGEQIGYETVRRDASLPWLLGGIAALLAGLIAGLAFARRIP